MWFWGSCQLQPPPNIHTRTHTQYTYTYIHTPPATGLGKWPDLVLARDLNWANQNLALRFLCIEAGGEKSTCSSMVTELGRFSLSQGLEQWRNHVCPLRYIAWKKSQPQERRAPSGKGEQTAEMQRQSWYPADPKASSTPFSRAAWTSEFHVSLS